MSPVQLFYGPSWFSGIDLVLNFLGLIIVLFIAIFAYKFHKINTRKKTYLALMWGMILLGVSLIFKMITYLMVYLPNNFNINYQQGMAQHGFMCADMLFVSVFIPYALINIIGLFILFSIYQKNKSVGYLVLVAYLILIAVALSTAIYFVLHLTNLVLFGLIAAAFYNIYNKNKHKNTLKVAASFTILGVSQVLFLMAALHPLLYFFGEVVQFIGYLVLLASFLVVLKHGKKERKIRHN